VTSGKRNELKMLAQGSRFLGAHNRLLDSSARFWPVLAQFHLNLLQDQLTFSTVVTPSLKCLVTPLSSSALEPQQIALDSRRGPP
jgi:hypothetical protein